MKKIRKRRKIELNLKNKPNLRLGEIDTMSYMKGVYEEFQALRRQKNKTNSKPNKANLFRIAYCVMRIAKRNLKKQSQFAPAQNGAKSYMKGEYINKPSLGDEKNKANQSQLKPILSAPKGLEERLEFIGLRPDYYG